ncbi:MAG: hypothetical protein QY318_00115 [Candidatus Dojkabacteria bacterium]|nr:MAG: hypothetical protein QY318_00115 [Candidatus Dojkabacteria bacterium]
MDFFSNIREFRIGEFTIFDTTLAFLGVLLLSPLLTKLFLKVGLMIPTVSWMLFVIPMGVIGHLIAGIDTPLTQNFIDPDGHYFTKIIVLGMSVAGIALIKRVDRKKVTK